MRPFACLVLALALLAPGCLAPHQEDEPANFTQLKLDFAEGYRLVGKDPATCEFILGQNVEAPDAEGLAPRALVIKCSREPYMCLFMLHPTEALIKKLDCRPNPDFSPAIDSRLTSLQKLG